MPRLIDADKLKEHYSWWEGGSQEMTLDGAKRIFDTIIDIQPSVEAEPVRHGHWINKTVCSICGEWEDFNDGYRRYCPNCGAKMDEVEEDADK